MATLTSSGVTLVKARTVPSTTGKMKIRELTLVLSSAGDGVTIPASVLGFTRIIRSSMAQKDDNTLAFLTCPSYNGTYLFVYNLAVATDADRSKPVAISGTLRVTVEGV
jgi:hypothetical protein